MPAKKINIASLVSYQVYPAKMGGQKGIALFYEYLSRIMPLTILGISSNDDSGITDKIKLVPIFGNSKLRYVNPLLFFSIRKYIKRNDISHLILEHPYYGWLGMMLKWITGVKLIIHSHNIEALRFKSTGSWWWGILWHYEKLTHRNANMNFFIHDDDRNYAIEKFKLKPERCTTITYGIEQDHAPSEEEKRSAANMIRSKYSIAEDRKILLFNGTLDYKPNRDALDNILEKINPLLLENNDVKYSIIICGNRLPASYRELADHRSRNIIYAGFVDDITIFFKGADIFINPVTDGGGIKTKLVEALGYDLSVITTESGATGIPLSVTGNKMKTIADADWKTFVTEIIEMDINALIPAAFFDHFYWGNIAAKAATALKQN